MPLMIDEVSFESLQANFVECVCKHFCCWIPSHQVNGNLMHLFIPCHRWPNSRRLQSQQSQQSQQSRHAKWLLLGFQGDSWQLQHFFLCEYMARCNGMTTGYIDEKGFAGGSALRQDILQNAQTRFTVPKDVGKPKLPGQGCMGRQFLSDLFDAKDHWSMRSSCQRCKMLPCFPQERKMICC